MNKFWQRACRCAPPKNWLKQTPLVLQIKQSPSNPYIEGKLKFYQKLFGDKARIQLNASGGGQIVIPFTSEKDFKSLTKRLQSEP